MSRTAGACLCAFVSITIAGASRSLHAQTLATSAGATHGVAPSVSEYLDAANGLAVDQLVEIALTRNADLLATRQRTLEAQGLLRQAGLRPNPVLDSEFSTGSPTGSPGEQEFSVGYAHTFELGGKRARRVDLGQAGLDLARLGVADRERTLRAEVQERYIAALAVIRNLEAVTQFLESTQQSHVMTQRRVSEGESPRVEEIALQAEVGRLTAERLLLGGEVQQAMLDLRVVAGFDVTEPLRLRPDWNRPGTTPSLAAALERGLASRQDLQSARQEELRSGAEVALAQAERVPDMAALVRYTDARSSFDQRGFTASGALAPVRDRDRILTAGLSMTLPLWSRNQGSIEAARARRSAAALRREYLERAIRAEITGAHARHLAARQAVETFETSVVQPAQESVRVLRASYAAGEVQLFDVLTEQRRLIDTLKAYTDALRQEALARVALERAVGVPLQ